MASKITTLFEDSAKTNALYPRTKQNAISDADGNPLTEVGFYTSETVGNGVDNVKVAFDMNLLWTNPSPTSSFSPQTVSLDLTEYKMAYIVWRTSIDATSHHDTTSLVDGLVRESVNRNGATTSQYGLSWRTYTVSSQSVVFDEGHQQTAFSNQTGVENNRMIPYKIYGIR